MLYLKKLLEIKLLKHTLKLNNNDHEYESINLIKGTRVMHASFHRPFNSFYIFKWLKFKPNTFLKKTKRSFTW